MRRLLCSLAVAVSATVVTLAPAVAGVVPLPRQMTALGGSYHPGQDTVIEASSADERNVAGFLSTFLQQHGVRATISAANHDQAVIRLSSGANDSELGPEGYRLLIGSAGVTISANGGAGLFYGLQTLEQLAIVDANGALAFPGMRIADWPQYRWRGIHLDVSRHFFPVPVVEQYIDLAARYKLNTFHWHLTDDQGWRIQIQKYPRLTSIGDCRAGTQVGGEGSTLTDGKRYCGYYTQAQIRDVVAYAKARYITIVPEIEGPGHSLSAVAAYPWLTCDGRLYAVRELWGVSSQIMCPTERTFAFMNDVIGEVAGLFPGPYIHIGGDEVPKDSWIESPFVAGLMRREHLADYDAVQGYFTRRIEQIARAHGKRIVGWDEILDGGVSTTAIVMAWQGADRGVIGAKRGNDVVMSPDGLLYLDAAQGDLAYEPLSIGGYLTTEMVYDYDPMPAGLTADQSRHIIGTQANVWAEYIPTPEHLFYMLLPRELAVAELAWTPRSEMNWYDFESRMGGELARLDTEGVPYRIPEVEFRLSGAGIEVPEQRPFHNEQDVLVSSGGATSVTLNDVSPHAVIHYTVDGSMATAASTTYTAPISVPPGGERITAVAVLPSGRVSAPSFLQIDEGP